MTGADVIRVGGECLRVVPWRHDDRVALLAPVPDGPAPGAGTVRRALDLAGERGFTEVVTAALTRHEQAGFLAAGFVVRERLHLLSHDLQRLRQPVRPEAAPVTRLRRSGRGDRDAVLALDREAFDGFWRLDHGGLDDAISATPTARFRVAVDGASPTGNGTAVVVLAPTVVGYAVTGRALRRGYLQRLAVHPAHRQCGVGTALVADGLRWLRRHRATIALVNTQEGNAAALALYERLGFRRRPDGLTVMGRPLGTSSA